MKQIEKTVLGALFGQAAGDAFGVPVEFMSRKEVRKYGLYEMEGMDTKRHPESRWSDLIPAGSWSDDTSMTIASMSSFIACNGEINYDSQMKHFIKWWEAGYYCCLNFPFGLGGTIDRAMQRYHMNTPVLDCGGKGFRDNGNGALMRILPFSLYCICHDLDMDETVKIISDASSITHGHAISKMSCFIWTEFLRSLVQTKNVEEAITYAENTDYSKWFDEKELSFVTEKRIRELNEEDIGETGYVVDTLKTAFYSMYHGHDYASSIQIAVNLGYDTDTSAAVTGMAAGILYGRENIPEAWMKMLRSKELLEKTGREFARTFI